MKIKDITMEEAIKAEKGMNYLVVSSQKRQHIESEKVFLLVPDFLKYSRLLASSKYLECMKEFKNNMGVKKNIWLHMSNVNAFFSSDIFWTGVIEMCLVDLSSISNKENVIINPVIVDLALSAKKEEVLRKIIHLSKKSTSGKVGLWTRNFNLLLSNFNLEKSGLDFTVTPYNKFGAGMRVTEDLVKARLANYKIKLIKDYASHFKDFKIEIPQDSLF